jgi:hypothetical protein
MLEPASRLISFLEYAGTEERRIETGLRPYVRIRLSLPQPVEFDRQPLHTLSENWPESFAYSSQTYSPHQVMTDNDKASSSIKKSKQIKAVPLAQRRSCYRPQTYNSIAL